MKNRLALILLILLALGISLYVWWLYRQKELLDTLLTQDRETQQQLKEENKRLFSESDELRKQLEKIQGDSLVYIASTTKLQLENESLQGKINQMIEDARQKETLVSGVQTDTEDTQSQEVVELQKELDRLKSENSSSLEKLKKIEVQLDVLDFTSQLEKSNLYYNLGVAYVLAKLYDEAIAAFEKSIKYNSVNPMAHYNLGLIMENIKFDNHRAINHYKKYLTQSPDAQDKEEVASWVERLQ